MLKLKEVRNRKRFTLDELAEKSGVSKRMISAYEANQNEITYTKLKQLADALGVHVLELTGEYVEPTVNIPGNLPDVALLAEKLTEKEKDLQLQLDMIALYKRQIELLEAHNKSLLTSSQLLEEKVLDLNAKLTHYESRAKSAVRSVS